MNSLTILLLCVPLIILLSGVKFQKVSVLFDNLPKYFQDNYLRRHIAFAWKFNLAQSFNKYTEDFQDVLQWWEDNASFLKNPADMYVVMTAINQTNSLLKSCCKKLKNTKRPIIHVKLWFTSPEKLTKKMFGKEIEGLYYYLYILKEGKTALENFNVDDDEVLNSWKNTLGRIGYLFSKPVFSKGILENAKTYASGLVNGNKKSA